jgi:hypothetical protein
VYWLAALGLAAAGAGGGRGLGFSVETAQIILLCITVVGAICWALALLGWMRLGSISSGETEEREASGGPARQTLTRVKLVDGEPPDVADGLVRAMGTPSWGTVPLLVKRQGDGLLVAVPRDAPGLRSVPCFSSCAVELRAIGSGKTEVKFKLDFSAVRSRARRVAGVLLVAGLLLLIALPLCLYLFALPSESGAVRGQVIQAIHIGHLLWPPWLVYAIHKRTRRATGMYLDAAANNAAVLADAFAARRDKHA